MKWIFVLPLMLGMVYATSACAASNSDAFVEALKATSSPCEVMAYKAGLYAGKGMNVAGIPTFEDVGTCTAPVKERSAAVYKDYAAKAANSLTAKDMKDVFIAWLSYFPVRISAAGSLYDGSDKNSPEAAAFSKAVSTLEVDELTL